jgi:hypothetical protein
MRIEDLQKIKNQRPFRPFRIRLTDGRELPVNHPDAVAWDPVDRPRLVLVLSGGDNWWIDIALSTALVEPLPVSPTGPAGTIAPEPGGGE